MASEPTPASDRRERLVKAVDEHFEEVDTMVGARVVRWIEESHLNLHEARALLALAQTKRRMTAAEVADLSGLDMDSAYQAVHSLHGRGLTDENSRRHGLTGPGRALMRSFTRARREGVNAYLAMLAPSDQRKLERALLHTP